MMASKKGPLILAVLVFQCLAPATATADPTAADRDSARRLMAEARQKRASNDLKGALTLFEAADAIMHVPTTGLEVARTHAELGHLVDARDAAVRVSHLAPEPHEPPQFGAAREGARALSDDLAKRIPTVKVVVRGAVPGTEAQVTVDNVPVPTMAIVVPRPVDPGHHRVAAVAGTLGGSAEVDVNEGEAKEVTIELVAPASLACCSPDAVARERPSRGGIGKPVMAGGVGIVVLGALVGSVAGLISVSKTSAVKSTCLADRCPPSAGSDIDSARAAATVSNLGFAAAGAGAAVAIVGLLLWRGEADAGPGARRALGLTPWVGTGAAGVTGTF